MHLIENFISFVLWTWILFGHSKGSEQEYTASSSHLSDGYNFEAYPSSAGQQNSPWYASNLPQIMDFYQQSASANDWKIPDIPSNQLDHEQINQNNHLQNQYGNNFIPSAVDTTFNSQTNAHFDSIQNEALFTQNNPIISNGNGNSASYNELENNNQQIHNAQTDPIPISKHVEITENVPYPIYKQVHVPVQRPVNINIPQSVLVPVPHSYPVHIPIVKPVAVPVIKEITIPIEKVIPYAVVKKVPYTVEKHEPYHVEKIITVHKKVPYAIKVPIVKTVIHRQNHHGHHHHNHHVHHGWY